MCLEALAEKGVQWTVDDLDGGGGLMANKNKSLASERAMVMCLWVPYLHWVTHRGSREVHWFEN